MRAITLFTDRHKTSSALPLAVYVLAFAIFAQGTSELMLAGLLPELAHDLHVSIPRAGLLISGFAIGMLIGAPVLAVLVRRWPRRQALVVFLAVYALAHIASALAINYDMLFASRIVGAFVYAGFWAVGAASAVDLVPDDTRGRAMGVVAGGLTVATVVGLPVGTVIGEHLGWRAAFWAVAVLSIVAMIAVLATVPAAAQRARDPILDLRPQLRALANRRLLLAYSITAVSSGSLLVTFSYLAPLLTNTTGIPSGRIPLVLGIYGIGALLGITIGGRTADRHPLASLYVGIVGVVLASIALAVDARQPVTAISLIFALGLFGFGINPTLNSRPFTITAHAPTLVAATNVSAFNFGITVAPWLGGLAISAGLGYPSIAWIGALLGLAALFLMAVSDRQERHLNADPHPKDEPSRPHASSTASHSSPVPTPAPAKLRPEPATVEELLSPVAPSTPRRDR